MTDPSEGDDAIWRETVTLASWETGAVRWLFLPSPMLRPLFTRSWVGLRRAVRQTSIPGTGASRQSGPNDLSFATCRPGPFTDEDGLWAFHPWTVLADARGYHRNPSRRFSGRGLPGDGRTCFPPSGAQELGSPTSLRLRRQTSCIMTVLQTVMEIMPPRSVKTVPRNQH